MTIKFGNFAIFIVKNFVVIWEAAKDCLPRDRCSMGTRHAFFVSF